MSLAGLDSLGKLATDRDKEPTYLESIYYLFWRKGIGYQEFQDTPIPYIFTILQTRKWYKEEENKEIKKSNRRI